jgi:hypothetical protein
MSKSTCLLCQDANPGTSNMLPGESGGIRTTWRVDCQGCGRYDVTVPGQGFLRTLSAEDRSRVAEAVRVRNAQGQIPELSMEEASLVLDASPAAR